MSTELFAIFGDPVSHSKSPLMHNMAFAKLGYDGCYGRYLLKNGKLLRDRFLELGLKGANVTVPHKEYAYKACDVLDAFAKKARAVNTIVEKNGELHGYNTDAPGFLKAIEPFGKGLRILLLGAGGTAQASSAVLKDAGYSVTILNRGKERLKYFQERGFEAFSWDDFTPRNYDLVANMTSAGLTDEQLPLPRELLESIIAKTHGCVDVIYGKETPFLKLARSYGKPALDGSDMLLYQGVIAFDIFTNNIFSQHDIENAMRPAFDI